MLDAIIVGAGPGGTTAAKHLAEKGFSVLILEKEDQNRDKPCGGWITPEVLNLAGWNQKKLDEIFWSPIRGLKIFSPKLFTFTMKKEKILSYGILRSEFDNALLQDAIDAGARIENQSRVRKVSVKEDKVIVSTAEKEHEAEIVIGADGTRSIVAECSKVRPAWNSSELVLDLVCETRIPKKEIEHLYRDDLAVIFYNLEGGYNWIYPKINQTRDDAWINIGVGCQLSKMKNSRQMLENHVRVLKKLDLLPEEIKLARHTGWTYATLNGPKKYSYGARVLLVGDAGGFSSNIAGEGIRTAMLTGVLAADTIGIVEDFSRKSLRNYEKAWKRKLKKEYDIGMMLQQALSRNLDSVDKMLEKLQDDIEGQEDLVKLLSGAEDLDKAFQRLIERVL
ncbi:MAG: NAD(P)/FAD-dependent oxidoreductase [Candidatus Helarchaeales archaeon]